MHRHNTELVRGHCRTAVFTIWYDWRRVLLQMCVVSAGLDPARGGQFAHDRLPCRERPSGLKARFQRSARGRIGRLRSSYIGPGPFLHPASRIGRWPKRELPFCLKWEVPFDGAGCPNRAPKSGSHFLIPKWEVVGQKREVVCEVSITAPIFS